jgi:hypothetical protein
LCSNRFCCVEHKGARTTANDGDFRTSSDQPTSTVIKASVACNNPSRTLNGADSYKLQLSRASITATQNNAEQTSKEDEDIRRPFHQCLEVALCSICSGRFTQLHVELDALRSGSRSKSFACTHNPGICLKVQCHATPRKMPNDFHKCTRAEGGPSQHLEEAWNARVLSLIVGNVKKESMVADLDLGVV